MVCSFFDNVAVTHFMQQGQLTIRIVFSSPAGVKQALAKAETSGPFIAEKYGPFDDTTTIQGIMIGVLII